MSNVKNILQNLVHPFPHLENKGKEHNEVPYINSYQEGGSHHPHSFSSPNHSPFLDSNVGKHFPKLDMNKFHGSNMASWVAKMEHYLSLHNIQDDITKLVVVVL